MSYVQLNKSRTDPCLYYARQCDMHLAVVYVLACTPLYFKVVAVDLPTHKSLASLMTSTWLSHHASDDEDYEMQDGMAVIYYFKDTENPMSTVTGTKTSAGDDGISGIRHLTLLHGQYSENGQLYTFCNGRKCL